MKRDARFAPTSSQSQTRTGWGEDGGRAPGARGGRRRRPHRIPLGLPLARLLPRFLCGAAWEVGEGLLFCGMFTFAAICQVLGPRAVQSAPRALLAAPTHTSHLLTPGSRAWAVRLSPRPVVQVGSLWPDRLYSDLKS